MTKHPTAFQVRNLAAFHRWPLSLCLGFAIFMAGLWGCGSNGGGLGDWQTTTANVVGYGNIQGSVLAPVAGLARITPRVSAAAGAAPDVTVYLEERPDITTKTDSQGKFILKNVPIGKYRIIAEKTEGVASFRQRSDLVSLATANTVQELASPLQLIEAKFVAAVQVLNRQTLEPLTGVTATLWGRTVLPSIDGVFNIGPVLSGVWPVKIEGSGYYTSTLLLNFNEKRQSVLFYQMTPLTSVDKNQAPLVEMGRDFHALRTYQSGNLFASGLDLEGDVITYTWEASSGTLTNLQGPSTVLTAQENPGQIVVTVTGTDSKGGTGIARMVIGVISGGAPPAPPTNHVPDVASAPFPVNGAVNLGTEIVLRWSGSDPDGDTLRYDLFLWPLGSPSSRLAGNLATTAFYLGNLEPFTRYFWQVVSRDPYDAISENSSVWQFETGDGNNLPPFSPANPTPANLTIDQLPNLLLSWTGGDPNGFDGVEYSVFLGTDTTALQLATMTTKTNAVVKNLALGKTYYWLVAATDQRGGTTRGPRWQFSTYSPPNSAPTDPIAVFPASGATNVTLTPQLRWTSSDPDGDEMYCDVFLGTSTPLTKVSSGQTSFFLTPVGSLKPNTSYFWEVLVRDARGGINATPTIWGFTTTTPLNHAPFTPNVLTPANNSIEVATQPVFSWTGGDPENDPVVYFVYLDPTDPPVTQVAGPISTTNWTPPFVLAEGQQYHWQIVASDSKGAAASSSVFHFTTQTTTDSLPPTLVSVSPTNKSTGVAPNAEITLTFSEPINPTSVTFGNSLRLLPTRAGTFTWDSPSSLRFTPAAPMPNGSYHSIILATGTIRDLANNLLVLPDAGGVLAVRGARYTFSVSPDIPIPSSFRSSGLSVAGGVGAAIIASVPELLFGQTVWAALVAETATVTAQVMASRMAPPSGTLAEHWKSSPEAAFRELERGLPYVGQLRTPDSMIRRSVSGSDEGVGTIQDFFIPRFGGVATTTPYPGNFVKAVCLAATDKLFLYVDLAINLPSYAMIAEIRKKFEEIIQPRVQDFFGNEPPAGPNGDARLTILLTDGMIPNLIGLFNGADLYPRNILSLQLRESNARKILYLKYSLANPVTRFGTVAHEYAHMVTFYQKQVGAGTSVFEETWLSEGFSKFAEEITGFGMQSGDDNTAEILRLMLVKWRSMSLTDWRGVENYGLSYLFVRFLAEEQRYKNTPRDATRLLCSSALTGISNVTALTQESFTSTLGRFYLSLLLNRHSSSQKPDYGLSDLNLNGSYSGISLPGVPVDVVPGTGLVNTQVVEHGCRFYKKISDGGPNLGIRFIGLNQPARAWFLDPRP